MEFSVNSKILLSHLNIVAGALGKNPVLPIMEDFLFELKGNVLKITGTDLETTIISKIDVDGKKDGDIAIPANTILQTLKTMNDIVLTIVLKDYMVEIISLTGNYKCSGEHPGDFPTPPDNTDSETITVATAELKKGINSTLFATSSDELRLAMTGIYMNATKDGFYLVATDAHKLVEYKINDTFELQNEIGVIVPSNSFKNLEKILGAAETIEISVNKSNAFFVTESTTIITRLIDAKYPQYKAVIPTDQEFFAKVNRKDLLGSLKRTLIYANKTTNQVMLNYTADRLDISTTDLDMGKEAKEQINAQLIGCDTFEIGYNAKFVVEMLDVIDNEEIEFKMKTKGSASIIDIETEKDNIKFLLMPVMIGN